MKPKRTLRRELAVLTSSVVVVLIAAYSVLLPLYFDVGVTESSALVLEIEAASYDRRRAENPNTPMPNTSTITAYIGIDTLPGNIREMFPGEIHENRLVKVFDSISDNEEDQHDVFMFFPYRLTDGQYLYLIEHIPTHAFTERENVFGIDKFIFTIWFVGLVFLLTWMTITMLILGRINHRTASLASWAQTIEVNNRKESHPDFGYAEFNDVAEQLQLSFRRMSDAIDREQSFLFNASHELRTPISIVFSNTELLERLNVERNSKPLKRIRRAVNNMRSLTETLLWLARESEEDLNSRPLSLHTIVTELIEDHTYLLEEKEVAVVFEKSELLISAPETACRIAISNLIRNAFQHTHRGTVRISLSSEAFTIWNEEDSSDTDTNVERGYGLGLLLVERIADRMGWKSSYSNTLSGRETVLIFSH